MEKDTGLTMTELKADGGASRDKFLMQFQADVIGGRIVRPVVKETTALGAACLAGLAVGFWKGLDEVKSRWKQDAVFTAAMNAEQRDALIAGWHKAVGRSRGWTNGGQDTK